MRQNRGDKGAKTLDVYSENRLGKLTQHVKGNSNQKVNRK